MVRYGCIHRLAGSQKKLEVRKEITQENIEEQKENLRKIGEREAQNLSPCSPPIYVEKVRLEGRAKPPLPLGQSLSKCFQEFQKS